MHCSFRGFLLTAVVLLQVNAYAQPASVVNVAGYGTPVAPGSVVAIFGTALSSSTAAASAVPLPLTLGGTSVMVNGHLPTPLFYVSAGQINAQLPYETPAGTATLSVNGSAPLTFPVAESAPGIVAYGSNRAVVVNHDYALNCPEHPAVAGGWATVYMTGQGAVSPPIPSGAASPGNPVALPVLPVTATIGGQLADVLFAGMTPGGVGLFQVNLRIPPMAPGDYPLVVNVGSAQSNAPWIAVSGDGRPISSIVRTMTFHQLTALPDNGPDHRSSTVISGDGKLIAYTYAPGIVGRLNKTYAMNFDGGGDHLIDSYLPGWNSGSILDISHDASKIVATEGKQIRIVNRGAAQALIAIDGVISGLKICGDGTRIFFLVSRDAYISGGAKPIPIQRGLYVMGSDGSGLRQIVGPSAVAGMLGTTATNSISPEFTVNGNRADFPLGVSRDGSRIIFGARKVGGYGPDAIFGVNLDGSGLHLILGPIGYVQRMALAADAPKVVYVTTTKDFVDEAGVINFDGSGQRVLRHDNPPLVQVSADGTSALLYNILYSTDGSGTLQVATSSNSLTPGTPVMNSTATRFVYSWVPPKTYSIGLSQLASAEINPLNLGSSPALANPALDRPYAVAGGDTRTTVTLNVSPHDKVISASYAILRDGVVEDSANGDLFLVDDGTWGDKVVDDGIFTSNSVIAAYKSPEGPRLLRLYAQVYDANNWRHGTLVDVAPFSVVLKPPK